MEFGEFLACCQETEAATTPVTLVGVSNADPWPFMMDPEMQLVEYCKDSCRSFCAVLYTRPKLDCYPLCSALFCADPGMTGTVATFGSTEAIGPQGVAERNPYLWACVLMGTLFALFFLTVAFSSFLRPKAVLSSSDHTVPLRSWR